MLMLQRPMWIWEIFRQHLAPSTVGSSLTWVKRIVWMRVKNWKWTFGNEILRPGHDAIFDVWYKTAIRSSQSFFHNPFDWSFQIWFRSFCQQNNIHFNFYCHPLKTFDNDNDGDDGDYGESPVVMMVIMVIMVVMTRWGRARDTTWISPSVALR